MPRLIAALAWLLAAALALVASAHALDAHAARHTRPQPRRGLSVTTGAARAIGPTGATVRGRVRPDGSATTYYFSYGRTRAYGARTARRRAGSRPRSLAVAVRLGRLRPRTLYHYRLVAHGHRTTYGRDHTFRTASETAAAFTAAPQVTTGTASATMPWAATVSATLNPEGKPATWWFQYGQTGAYGAQSAAQDGGAGSGPTAVAQQLRTLDAATTYHFRIVASNCGGCAGGTSYGADGSFTTPPEQDAQQADADRAASVYQAMQRVFYASDGSHLYAPASPASADGRRYSFLWPFSRALVGTLTLSGVPASRLHGASYDADVADRLSGLASYLDTTASPPGYDSYPVSQGGGDKYYDDQAWIGLALTQHYRLTGTASSLSGAEGVFRFVYPNGFDGGMGDVDPGGVFWVRQGSGVGASNHDRTTTSNAPNAELGFRLEQLDSAGEASYDSWAAKSLDWVDGTLYGADPSHPHLVLDKVRSDGTIDHTLWTYNQGALIAARLAAYEAGDGGDNLSEAETIARAALSTFSESDYLSQPAAFDAIFFRDLLQLSAVTGDDGLRAQISDAIQRYADDVWSRYRTPQDTFRLPSTKGSRSTLLDQGALLQIYSALAWDAGDYDRLP